MIAYFCEAVQSRVAPVKIIRENNSIRGQTERTEVAEICAAIPTFERFAISIGTYRLTLVNWAKEFPDFAEAYKICQDAQKDFLIQSMMTGRTPSLAAIFVAKNLTDMRDEKSLSVSQPEREKPALAENHTPAQLESLKAAVLAAQAAGVRLVIDETEKAG